MFISLKLNKYGVKLHEMRVYLLIYSAKRNSGSGISTITASISEMWANAESTSAFTTGISEM